jgi:KipI family sensor histidine kinase inhibitor
MKVYPYGESALYVDLEMDDLADRAERTQAVARALRTRVPRAEVVLGAGSIAVVGLGAWDDIESVVADAMRAPPQERRPAKVHEIRVIYDGEDLVEIAGLAGLSVADVATLHASREYGVELVGFLPGFAYLASVDLRLVVPRRGTPRPRVEPRTVAVAGPYTAIYPVASPGGWRLIGRAIGVELFDPQRDPPALFEPGDRVRFVPQDG